MNLISLWAAVLVGCVSCTSSSANDDETPSGAACPSDSTPTYDNFGRAFMTNYCVQCHSSSVTGAARQGAPDDHNFDSLDAIHATELEHIDEVAAAGPHHTNAIMPPTDPKPSLVERQQLGEWLACGAP
jgi:uncharacterized membrane protein